MVKPNIGTVNALIRITCGFTMLAWATAKMVKFPWRDSYLLIAMLAGMKIAEGITRFCPLTAMFEQYQEKQQNQKQNQKQDPPLALAENVINPT